MGKVSMLRSQQRPNQLTINLNLRHRRSHHHQYSLFSGSSLLFFRNSIFQKISKSSAKYKYLTGLKLLCLVAFIQSFLLISTKKEFQTMTKAQKICGHPFIKIRFNILFPLKHSLPTRRLCSMYCYNLQNTPTKQMFSHTAKAHPLPT